MNVIESGKGFKKLNILLPLLTCGQAIPTIRLRVSQYILSNWVIQSLCLDTVPLFEDHTGQIIADAFQEVFENWNLSSEKLVATTTDSASSYITVSIYYIA